MITTGPGNAEIGESGRAYLTSSRSTNDDGSEKKQPSANGCRWVGSPLVPPIEGSSGMALSITRPEPICNRFTQHANGAGLIPVSGIPAPAAQADISKEI